MIQRACAHVQENTLDAHGLCHQNPGEDCVWETPWPASLGKLTTASDNQQIEGPKNSKRCDQESQLVKNGSGQSNHRIFCCSKPAKKSILACLSRFSPGGLVADIPGVSSKGIRRDSVFFHGVIGIH